MEYVVAWQLIGRDARVIDDGVLDSPHPRFGDAVLAANEFLRAYGEVEPCARGCWRARRSSDADLFLRVRITASGDGGSRFAAERT